METEIKEVLGRRRETRSYPGTLIALEGIDGSGKTSTMGGIRSARQDWEITREPWFQSFRDLLKTGNFSPRAELHLFIADRLHHIDRQLEMHLLAGSTVITDRYVASTYAYQGVKFDACDYDIDSMADSIADNCIPPDHTIYLDCPVDVASKRRPSKDVFEDPEYLRKVKSKYEEVIRNGSTTVVDSTQEPDEVVRQCVSTIDRITGSEDDVTPVMYQQV